MAPGEADVHSHSKDPANSSLAGNRLKHHAASAHSQLELNTVTPFSPAPTKELDSC